MNYPPRKPNNFWFHTGMTATIIAVSSFIVLISGMFVYNPHEISMNYFMSYYALFAILGGMGPALLFKFKRNGAINVGNLMVYTGVLYMLSLMIFILLFDIDIRGKSTVILEFVPTGQIIYMNVILHYFIGAIICAVGPLLIWFGINRFGGLNKTWLTLILVGIVLVFFIPGVIERFTYDFDLKDSWIGYLDNMNLVAYGGLYTVYDDAGTWYIILLLLMAFSVGIIAPKVSINDFL